MAREFVERRDDGYYASGTRVSIASVVYHFRLGASPETILQKFPALGSLSTVYGAIAYYLDNQRMLDTWLDGQQQKWNQFESTADDPPRGLAQDSGRTRPVV
jgi:hypothetical protein